MGLEGPQEPGTGEHSDRATSGEEDPVGDSLLARHLVRDDEHDAHHSPDQIGREEPQDDLAPSEPPQCQTEDRRQSDVAEPEEHAG